MGAGARMTHGGKRPGAGRPRAEAPRANTIAIRLTDAEYLTVTASAETAEQSISDYCRALVLGDVSANANRRTREKRARA